MWGAVIGDLAGSIYRYEQIKEIKKVNLIKTKTIPDKAFFSDNTILTVAIIDAIEHDKDYKKYLKVYGNKYINYKPEYKPYFDTTFSPDFIKWLKNEQKGKSIDNDAIIRILPIGFMFETEEEVRKNVRLANTLLNYSEEAIKCAETIALIIYYGCHGLHNDEIIDKMNIKLQYKPFKKFNTTCSQTIDNCLYALFTSSGIEESIRKVISYGGNTVTNACIVGSMAEALGGIENELIDEAKQKIPQEFTNVIEKAYEINMIKCLKNNGFEI